MAPDDRQSRYVIFADESGDHGLNAKSHSRVFLIAFAIFHRDVYNEIAVPTMKEFKKHWFGSESTSLHERDIRKGEGAFRALHGDGQRQEARESLRELVHSLPFGIVAVGIDKDRFIDNPERLGTAYQNRFIETLTACLVTMPDMGASDPPTEIVADSRGHKEDQQLQSLIDELTDSDAAEADEFRFRIRFTTKADVEVGVEIADLIANPIARRVLNQRHELITYDLLEPKFLRHPADPSRFALIILDRE